jgi:hypothetical protein
VLILDAFARRQLAFWERFGSGGPADPDMLFTIEDLRADFDGAEMVELDVVEKRLAAGRFHAGRACVIQAVVRRL